MIYFGGVESSLVSLKTMECATLFINCRVIKTLQIWSYL